MFNSTDNRIDNLINAIVMITNASYADRGHLPQIVVINLSNGDIELFLKARRN
jgi:hypothetical protein